MCLSVSQYFPDFPPLVSLQAHLFRLKKKLVPPLRIKLYNKDIYHHILQLYYDKQCSPKSWNSLLMSQLTENNRRGTETAFHNLSKT